MNKKVRIVLDTMGYENELSHAIKAAIDFKTTHQDVEIVLVGNEEEIKPLLNNHQFEIIHTTTFIDQKDTVISARRKTESSMHKGLNYLKENSDVDGMLTAGNTAVFVYNAYSIIGLLDHIKKPAFMPFVPTMDQVGMNILDVGASIQVDGEDLFNFAIMANAIAKNRVENPKIGILNIGTEEHKGFSYHHDAHKLLLNSSLNYKGFIEPKNIVEREVDVLVTDGFAGNIALKTMEGVALSLGNFLKKEYKKKRYFLAGLFSLPIFKKVKKIFDYRNNAGAFVLGTKKILVKTHGSADYLQFMSALRMLYESVQNNVLETITKDLEQHYGK